MSTESVYDQITELVRTRDIIICSGSGGVGKTTTAAVLGMEAARLGRRAVVVTIDPAKRLADALGLGELGIGNQPRSIEGRWPGSLAAVMLDTKSTFDDLVVGYSSDPEQAERILANRFYRAPVSAQVGIFSIVGFFAAGSVAAGLLWILEGKARRWYGLCFIALGIAIWVGAYVAAAWLSHGIADYNAARDRQAEDRE